MAMPAPPKTVIRFTALERCPGSLKLLPTRARTIGSSSAAKTPCAARQAISSPVDGLSAHATDAAAKPTRADAEQPLRAEPVAEAPAEQQQRGQRQRIRVHHPGDPTSVCVEILRDPR
jgi:hypothetical protein